VSGKRPLTADGMTIEFEQLMRGGVFSLLFEMPPDQEKKIHFYA
jgi:hypothetical protein